MKPLPDAARTKNLSGKEFCRYCLNDGYVVVTMRPAARLAGRQASSEGVLEEMGPCPYCEQGVRVEFQGGAPWGTDGYWRGRKDNYPIEPHSSALGWKQPPPSIARSLMQDFAATLGIVLSPPAGADGAADLSGSPTPPESPAAPTSTSSGPFAGFGTLIEDATP